MNYISNIHPITYVWNRHPVEQIIGRAIRFPQKQYVEDKRVNLCHKLHYGIPNNIVNDEKYKKQVVLKKELMNEIIEYKLLFDDIH